MTHYKLTAAQDAMIEAGANAAATTRDTILGACTSADWKTIAAAVYRAMQEAAEGPWREAAREWLRVNGRRTKGDWGASCGSYKPRVLVTRGEHYALDCGTKQNERLPDPSGEADAAFIAVNTRPRLRELMEWVAEDPNG